MKHPTLQPERRRVHRDVVSFVRRSARMNPSQTKAWDAHHDRFVVEVTTGETSTSVAPQPPIDWAQVFGRDSSLIVEIGSGNGDSLVPMAAARPEVNVVAFEVFAPAVASTLGKLARDKVTNVRVLLHDGVGGLTQLFAPASITELWTHFPDPWHKARHHKRRLVSRDVATLAASRLVDGGLWRLATDWDDYALAMREVLDATPGLANAADTSNGWAPRNPDRPLTRFERRGLDAGRTIRDLTYRRLERGS